MPNAAKSDLLMADTIRPTNMAINFAVLLHVAVKWNLRGTNIPQKLAMPTLRKFPAFIDSKYPWKCIIRNSDQFLKDAHERFN